MLSWFKLRRSHVSLHGAPATHVRLSRSLSDNSFVSDCEGQTMPSSDAVYLSLHNDGLKLQLSDTSRYSLSHHECRENCRCNICTIQPSRHRNVNNSTLLVNEMEQILIQQAGIDIESKYIYLQWSDGHNGWIDLNEWINEDDSTCVDSDSVNSSSETYAWSVTPPNINIDNGDYFDYSDMMFSDRVLIHFYQQFAENGICLLRNTPLQQGTSVGIGKRLANHLYTTVFGEDFSVDVQANAVNPAYTNIKLPLHTDLPYYMPVPENFVFHCLTNEGSQQSGASVYIDGFWIAKEMKLHYGSEYEILTKIPVPFRDHQTGKWDFSAHKKVIELNECNANLIEKIHFNEGVRSSIHWKIDDGIKKDVYHALSVFQKMAQCPDLQFQFVMQPGDCFVFRNTRILHGRNAFAGARKMEGCYFLTDAMNATKKEIEYRVNVLGRL